MRFVLRTLSYGDSVANEGDQFTSSSHGLCFLSINISNPNISHSQGAFLGRNLSTNAPVYFNGFIGPPELPNPSVFICGIPGSR